MRDLFKQHHMTRVKALTDADRPGTFEAVVSVFNNVDSDGDVVMPGAFTKTLAEGLKPLVYAHQWGEVPVGQTLEARETPEGLYVKGRLFVGDDEDHARAREVYAAMRGGALTEFSWGGKVTSETRVEAENGDVTFELNEISLVEYGPCLKGVNRSTRLLAVKSLANAGLLTFDEARVVIGAAAVDTAKTDAVADALVVDPAVAPLGADSDTNGLDVDTGGPQGVPGDDGWSSTLAAVRAGVLTTAEARNRLGLPVLPPASAVPADVTVVPAGLAHAAALAELDLAA